MKKLEIQIRIKEQELYAIKTLDDDVPDFVLPAERELILSHLLRTATYEVVKDEVIEDNS